MAADPDLKHPPDDAESVQATKPDAVPPGVNDNAPDDPYSGPQYDPPPDKKYWIQCLADAERAEQDWRKRGREIIQIYRGETKPGKGGKTPATTFNILYANTEVMLPAVYQKPPKPVVRSRFQNVAPPPEIPMGPPPGMMPPGGPMQPPPGLPPPPGGGPVGPGGPLPPTAAPPTSPMPGGGPMPPGPPPGPSIAAPQMAIPGGPPIPPGAMQNAAPVPPPGPPQAPPQPPTLAAAGGAIPPPAPPPAIPGKPLPEDIETAASVMQKALEVVLDDESSNEAVKLAIKDVLLPGRGCCRVRWKPEMKTEPLPGGPLPDGTAPTTERKVWEEVLDEYVFWEDMLVDPVRAAPDTDWIAFRHLFTKESLELEFGGSPEYEKLKGTNGGVERILRWTDESAAKNPVGGGAPLKSTKHLGDYVKKAMIWEIWHRPTRRIIWFIREVSGLVLRIDPDSYQLKGFYPIPVPMLAVVTTDSRIPRAYYELYAKLAEDLDETSARISALTKHIKARGAYNAASKEIADLLTAGDNKMVPVDGVDMINGGLSNHIWMVPIEIFVQALNQLYIARDQIKQAIYEIMGISDIMRGATKATETATAQRIKGSMGMGRLEDQKQAAGIFVRDLLRLKAELIAQNFEPETLEAMTGETVTPEVLSILRSDFQRTCLIDIESDSTVIPDLEAEQQGMAMVMQSVQLVMQGTQQMLMTQILPPPQVLQLGLELLKMALHPVPYSRGVVELVNGFAKQLAMMPPMPPMLPPPGPPPGEAPPDKKGAPPGHNTAQPPALPNGMPPGMQPPPGLQ